MKKISKEDLCERCKKKKWICGVRYPKRVILLCDDCAFPNVKIVKKKKNMDS